MCVCVCVRCVCGSGDLIKNEGAVTSPPTPLAPQQQQQMKAKVAGHNTIAQLFRKPVQQVEDLSFKSSSLCRFFLSLPSHGRLHPPAFRTDIQTLTNIKDTTLTNKTPKKKHTCAFKITHNHRLTLNNETPTSYRLPPSQHRIRHLTRQKPFDRLLSHPSHPPSLPSTHNPHKYSPFTSSRPPYPSQG